MNTRLFLLLFLAFVPATFAQQPAPPVEFSTLERPEPLIVIPGAKPSELLEVVSDHLKANGFKTTNMDPTRCTLEVRKPLSSPEGFERILVWMERDVTDPPSVRFFLLYAKYIKVFGNVKMGRVIVTPDQEAMATEAWRGSLIEKLSAIKDKPQ